ncbi:MAG: Cytoplasmic and mitochondrial histidine tRNA synthetase [Chrysothrix sp. TS-e1954]|nr:MAG: Cytoplasmic and mitochondrial histidine tRNA synthetase [Chrysothrix sp. TS-e1954]
MPGTSLKTPKGTRDWDGKDVVIRDNIFASLTKVFKRHGAVTIDTPVFELKEVLTGKYGEDSKLIYDLADQGGEISSLRYDLTVPFARWLAMNPQVQNIKRYHIAKVYRRDQPQMARGRMREFYQCDFDIASGAGAHDKMLPDAEIIRITCEVFESLRWNNFTIKINHRKILDGIFEHCGVPTDLLRPISSAVDKLDKAPWDEVRREMVEEKHLDPAVADKIKDFVLLKGGQELVDKLQSSLESNASAKEGLEDMRLLFSYLSTFNVLDKISFDMSLARGLDYYTGVIYEVIAEKQGLASTATAGVGSIAAGGRYDNLVNMFSGKQQVPCVGISFGVDRIFSIIKAQQAPSVRSTETDVYVMAFGGKGFTGMLQERMEITRTLWDADVKAEFSWKVKPKLPAQFKSAEQGNVPFAIILGEDELKAGKVKIKEMGLPDGHPEKDGVPVEKDNIVEEITKRLRVLNGSDVDGAKRGIETQKT